MIEGNYTIHHFDIARPRFPQTQAGRVYCVFWYQSVPLGHAYMSPAVAQSQQMFGAECIRATFPTLLRYNTVSQAPAELREPADLDSLARVCGEVLSAFLEPSASPTCDVSVVICTRNRARHLERCLEALTRQRCHPREIIVIDNASVTDETREVALSFAGVRYVREERPGLDIARNTGVRSANCGIIAFTDDDTIPDPEWVYRISESFRNNNVAAITGLVLAGSLKNEAEIIFEKYWPFNRGFVPRLYDSRFFNATLPAGPPVWEIGAGANMAFRREIFDDVGYFDERLDVGAAGCSGDSELWYRILANGFSILYEPLAVVQHFHRSSMENLRRQLYSYMKGFTVAILIQHQRFGHKGNLYHLFREVPKYYLSLIRKGFPNYRFQYRTLFNEMSGICAGLLYYARHRNSNTGIYYGHDNF